jgi:hypothetical protein
MFLPTCLFYGPFKSSAGSKRKEKKQKQWQKNKLVVLSFQLASRRCLCAVEFIGRPSAHTYTRHSIRYVCVYVGSRDNHRVPLLLGLLFRKSWRWPHARNSQWSFRSIRHERQKRADQHPIQMNPPRVLITFNHAKWPAQPFVLVLLYIRFQQAPINLQQLFSFFFLFRIVRILLATLRYCVSSNNFQLLF